MPTTPTRRVPALLAALAAAGLLVAAAHPSHAGAPAPALPKRESASFAPALPASPGPTTVVCKLGRALLEERDAQLNLRTETYRDEIETASAAPTKSAPAKG